MPQLTIHPVTPALAADLSDLMDDVAPARRCSCMYWRIGSGYRKRQPEDNREDLLSVIEEGPPPGLLAFDGDDALGWCQVTPKLDLPALEASQFGAASDDLPDHGPVWSISCIVIRTGHRRRGIATALIEAAIEFSRQKGAVVLEAYPLDAATSSSGSFTGYASTFERLGFVTIAMASPSRPVMSINVADEDPATRSA